MVDLVDAVAAAVAVLGDRARRDVALGPFTTYRVGGPAALMMENATTDDLHLARRAIAASGLPVLIVGRGSNLLVADGGFPGLAITLGDDLAGIEAGDPAGSGPIRVRAGGAVRLPVLARRTAAAGLRGLEWAVGVPGSLGGAVRMNAGGHGSDVRATLRSVRLFDLAGSTGEATTDVALADLGLGYRTSAIRPSQVVVSAEFELAVGDRAEAEAEIAAVVAWRHEHQPGGANAGSVFANPRGPDDSAGRLIEGAGLRGHRRGSARVSPKHANFIQVDEGGSADDVLALIEEVRAVVLAHSGIVLALENRLVGFTPTGSPDYIPSTKG